MINPEAIPQIPGNMAALSGHATTVSGVGTAFPDTGSRVHSTWQGLAAVYEAPEAGQLFGATGPVQAVSSSVGQDVAAVGAALSSYAGEVTAIKARLEALRAQAIAFGAVTAKEDWREDEGNVERHNQLLSDINGAVADFMDAQRRCANAILARYSEQRYTAENGDGTITAYEFGYTKEQLDGALAQDAELPWGKSEEHDRGFFGDVGAYFGGLWTGGVDMVKGLGALIGYADGEWSWSTAGGAWKGLGIFALALSPVLSTINAHTDLPGLKKGTLHNTLIAAGKSIIAYDTWGEDKSKAAGMTTFNVVSAIIGTKGAGAGLRGTGAAAQASKVSVVAKAGAGMVRVGDFIGKLPTTESVIGSAARRIPGFNVPPINLPDVDIPPTHVDPPQANVPPPSLPDRPSVGDGLRQPATIDREGVRRFGDHTPDPAPAPATTTVGIRDGVIGNWPTEAPNTPAATPDAPARPDDAPIGSHLDRDDVLRPGGATPDPAPAPAGTTVGIRDGVLGRWPVEAPNTPAVTPDTAPRPDSPAGSPLVGDGVIDGHPNVDTAPTPDTDPAPVGTGTVYDDSAFWDAFQNRNDGHPHVDTAPTPDTDAAPVGVGTVYDDSAFWDGFQNRNDSGAHLAPADTDLPQVSDAASALPDRPDILPPGPDPLPGTPPEAGGPPGGGSDGFDPTRPPASPDGPTTADQPDGSDLPSTPTDHTRPTLDLLVRHPVGPRQHSLGILPESHLGRGQSGLIETVDGRPVSDFLRDVGEQRARELSEGRSGHRFGHDDARNMAIALDRRTGQIFEGIEARPGDVFRGGELHPLLRQRFEELRSSPASPHNNGIVEPGARNHPTPEESLGHARVNAVDELLWRRGPAADASVLDELLVDDLGPSRGDGPALLAGTPAGFDPYISGGFTSDAPNVQGPNSDISSEPSDPLTFSSDRDAERYGAAHWNDYADRLPAAQREALFRFTEGLSAVPNYRDLQNYLRGYEPPRPGVLEDIAEIDRALAGNPVPEDVVVSRGIDLHQSGPPEVLRGTVQHEPGYMPTSLGSPHFDSKEAVLHLRVPKGTPAMYLERVSAYGRGERELLLGRDLRWRVDAVRWQDGQWHVEGTVLPRNAPGHWPVVRHSSPVSTPSVSGAPSHVPAE